MNSGMRVCATLVLAACGLAQAWGQEVRTITINEDRDQKFKTSKVYELQNVRSDDVTPFVLGAVKRYNSQGDVQKLNYKKGGKEYIVVSTGIANMPFIDDLVKTLDYACPSKDANGSSIDGDGIYRFSYCPKNRAAQTMLEAIQDLRSDGTMYFDAPSNMFYWKDSKSNGEAQLAWLKALDRPVPQVQLTLNAYEINENDFRELGIDYVAWKNGPGATLFGTGWNFLDFSSGDRIGSITNALNIADKGPLSSSLGGFMVAPQFDATFLRMLAQKGKARVANSSTLTVINDFSSADPGPDNFDGARYKLRFTPNYQNITKDADRNASISEAQLDYYFYLRTPTISFHEDMNFEGQREKDNAAKAASLMFGWVLRVDDPVEQTTDNGRLMVNRNQLGATLTLACGGEKLLGCFEKEHNVNQNNSMPFLGDIPGLKYLFGMTVESKTHTRVFVTVSASPVLPGSDLSPWAGEVISAASLVDSAEKDKNAK